MTAAPHCLAASSLQAKLLREAVLNEMVTTAVTPEARLQVHSAAALSGQRTALRAPLHCWLPLSSS